MLTGARYYYGVKQVLTARLVSSDMLSWSANLGSPITCTPTVDVGYNLVMVGTADGRLHAFFSDSGLLAFVFNTTTVKVLSFGYSFVLSRPRLFFFFFLLTILTPSALLFFYFLFSFIHSFIFGFPGYSIITGG